MPGLRDQGSSGHRRSRRADATATAAYRFGCGCWAEDEYREIARLNGLGDVQTVGVGLEGEAQHPNSQAVDGFAKSLPQRVDRQQFGRLLMLMTDRSSSTLAPLVRATLSRARMSFGKQDPP